MSDYTPIPVTRSTASRPHADVSYGYNKQGDLSLVLSPSFITAHPALGIGAKVLVGFDATTKGMRLTPTESGTATGLRTVRARSGFAGAGSIIIAARNLPQGLPGVEKRSPVTWTAAEDDAVVLVLSSIE